MSTNDTLRDKLNKILADQLGIPDMEKYPNDASLWNDLGCDELDLLEITMALEEDFEIELDADVLDCNTTIQDVLTLITKTQRVA